MFKNLAKGKRINRYMKAPVDLTELPTEQTCKKLYLEGFPYIGITKDAAKWLKSCPKMKLESLVSLKTLQGKAEEVEILQSVLDAKNPKPKARKGVIKKESK